MEIRINKTEVFNEVEKRSSIEGYAIPENYDKVWANKEKGAILDSFWVEGCTAVVQLLKKYLKSATAVHSSETYDESEIFNLSVEMPGRYNDNLDGNILTDIKMLIASNILHGWFNICAPELSAKYLEESNGYSEDLRVKLLYRKSPEDDSVTAKEDMEDMKCESEALSQHKTDEKTICLHCDALKYPELDEEPLIQSRCRCY